MRNRFVVLFLLLIGGQSSKLLAQSPGTFTATGNMTTPRVWQTATLLPDGRVLITGGSGAGANGVSENLASAELYDPSTESFSATGTMITAKVQHTATLLANGKVLVAGGDGTPGSAELYDPATETFTPAGRMVADGSYFHTATLLPDGRVLFVAQGYYGSGAQIYDPSTGTFTLTGNPLATPDGDNTATTLADGKLLITQTSETMGEVYDPPTGTFSRTVPRIPWIQGTATLLLNGQVLLTGGNAETDVSALAGLYTPFDVHLPPDPFVLAPGTFSPTGIMAVARGYSTSTLLPDGKVLIAGGEGDLSGDISFQFASAELYDHGTATFSRAGDMTAARAYHTATLLNNGKVLITGGCCISPSGAELYTPASIILPPSLFSVTGANQGQAAVWHSTTGVIVSAMNPATAGEALSMYTSNLAESGVIPPQVIVGGRLAQVLYFGAAPGYSGFYQVNFRTPDGVAAGSAVTVRLTYLGRWSNEVSIAVR